MKSFSASSKACVWQGDKAIDLTTGRAYGARATDAESIEAVSDETSEGEIEIVEKDNEDSLERSTVNVSTTWYMRVRELTK